MMQTLILPYDEDKAGSYTCKVRYIFALSTESDAFAVTTTGSYIVFVVLNHDLLNK